MNTSSKAQILIIDDEVNLIEVLNSALAGEGYLVDTAIDPAKAEVLIDQKNYDLVVTDLKMEPIDGLEILRCVKRKDKDTQVLMMTAFGSVETAISTMKAGALTILLSRLNLMT